MDDNGVIFFWKKNSRLHHVSYAMSLRDRILFCFYLLMFINVTKKRCHPVSRTHMQGRATNFFFLYSIVTKIQMRSNTYQRLHQKRNVLKFYKRKLTPIRFGHQHTHDNYEHAYTRFFFTVYADWKFALKSSSTSNAIQKYIIQLRFRNKYEYINTKKYHQ